jgi:SAM-dependent methyltransferase
MMRLAATLRAWSRRVKRQTTPAALAAVDKYLAGGRKPWSEGYWEYRQQYTAAALSDGQLMQRFRDDKSLPENYGARLDERVVEYPWVLARLAERPGSVLDAGATLSYVYLLNRPALTKRKVMMCSLTLESEYQPGSNVAYLVADLRHAPFIGGSFDNIVCISTLEHIGLDSTQVYGPYGAGENYREHRPTTYRLAVQEFQRLLAPHGRLYLTVPFGQHQQFGWLQQFDEKMLEDITGVFNGQIEDLTFFRFSAAGWQRATMAECRTEQYFDIHQEKTMPPDYAAAARAVACLALINTSSVSSAAGQTAVADAKS